MRKPIIVGSREEQFVHEYEVYDINEILQERLTFVVSLLFDSLNPEKATSMKHNIELIIQYYDGGDIPSRILHTNFDDSLIKRLNTALDEDASAVSFPARVMNYEEMNGCQAPLHTLPEAIMTIPLHDERRYSVFFLRTFVIIGAINQLSDDVDRIYDLKPNRSRIEA